MNKNELSGLIDLLYEASSTLQALEDISDSVPSFYRYPIVDELYGYAKMLEDQLFNSDVE
ncbi:hypothetical protein D3C85_1098160 [compost metagenome]